MSKENNYNNNSSKFIFIFLITFCLIKTAYSACNSVNCPPLRGVCSGKLCVCEEGYTTIKNKNIQSNGVFCNYHLKSRFVAFLLELFFPFGVGHFYSGKILLSTIKIGLFVLMIVMCCSVLCCVNIKAINSCSFVICLILVLCLIALVLMEICDLLFYALGVYTDGNGIEMY